MENKSIDKRLLLGIGCLIPPFGVVAYTEPMFAAILGCVGLTMTGAIITFCEEMEKVGWKYEKENHEERNGRS